MINRVEISPTTHKDLRSIPAHLLKKLQAWIKSVEVFGLEETRRFPGFHDESLQGKRFGQRSIRLNRAYRAIYRIRQDDLGKHALLEEVNKHEH